MNKAAEELCGWKQAEAHGKPFASVFKVINETTHELYENLLERVLLTGEDIEHTNNMIVTSKDNTERIITHSAAPIKDKKNKVIGVVFVFQDITEKKKLLENLQRNQKLESLGVLAGGIAHDFNNLIGGILGYIDLAIEETRDKKVKGYLTNAINIMDRARSLTSQLLTFAKGGSPIKKIEDLRQLIQDSVQFALSGSNINCQYDIPNDLWLCVIDKSQICPSY